MDAGCVYFTLGTHPKKLLCCWLGCKAPNIFHCSQVECNRLLLIACQRRQAYLSEIEKLKMSPDACMKREGKGSLTISDIQLPLKKEFVKKIGSVEGELVIISDNG